MSRFIYLRGLRQVDHTVFGVVDGQKFYYSPLNNRRLPYASGQQVKRSIMDAMVAAIPGERRAPITFNYEIVPAKKGGGKTSNQKEPWNPCDPSYVDQLIGGWMRAQKGSPALKRRSPLSISAFRPLHPSLANLESSESGTFDRSDNPDQHKVVVRDEKGNIMTDEEVQDFLSSNDRSLPMRNWLDLGSRANGLFIYDIAIDKDRLFKVSTNQYDAALTPEMIDKLKKDGWEESGSDLIAPPEMQEKIVDALSEALVNWRITSNQSRTFSPQGNLALAVTHNANKIVNAIRADLKDNQEDGSYDANPIVDKSVNDTKLFVAPSARGYISGIEVNANASEDCAEYLKDLLTNN